LYILLPVLYSTVQNNLNNTTPLLYGNFTEVAPTDEGLQCYLCRLSECLWLLGKVLPYSLPSVTPGAYPCVLAVSPQVTFQAIHLAVDCHYFPPAVTSAAFIRWRHLYTVAHIRFQHTTHLLTRKGWKAELAWLVVSHQLQVEHGTGKVRQPETRCSTTVQCNQVVTIETRTKVMRLRILSDDWNVRIQYVCNISYNVRRCVRTNHDSITAYVTVETVDGYVHSYVITF